jgi:hypothetical protein
MRFSKVFSVAALSLALAVGGPVVDPPEAFAKKASAKSSAKHKSKYKKRERKRAHKHHKKCDTRDQIRCKVLSHVYDKALDRLEKSVDKGRVNKGLCKVVNKSGTKILALGVECELPALVSEDAYDACLAKGVSLNGELVEVILPTADVTVTVLDNSDNSPIDDAAVTISYSASTVTVTTGGSGVATFSGQPTGQAATITATKADGTASVVVSGGFVAGQNSYVLGITFPVPPPPSLACPCWDITAIAALAADPLAGCFEMGEAIDGDPDTFDVWCIDTGSGPALSTSPSGCSNDTDLTQTNVITYDFTADPVNGSALADQCTADLVGLGLPLFPL